MPELPVRQVPTTLVTGALGVGKTTAILDLFAHRPPDGRWAVLVNEFGRVGIDGAVLSGGGVAVREVAGGCICCTAGLSLRVALVRLLREVRPDRLLVEPTGLAHPAAVLDTMQAPGLREAIARRAVITLVDPRRSLTEPPTSGDPFADQVEVADVLVANRCDGVGAERLDTWRAEAAALYPPKSVVATTTFGQLDPAWLDLEPGRRVAREQAHAHGADGTAAGVVHPGERAEAGDGHHTSCGWVRPRDEVFDRLALEEALRVLVRPGPALPAGVSRLKGVFRTTRGWLGVDADDESIRWRPVGWRTDSRVEVIAEALPAPDWDAAEALLLGARWSRE